MNKTTHKNNLDQIAGDYQYKALRSSSLIQRQWHKNRHNLLYFLNFFSNNDTFLDVGCGSGNVIFEFSKQVKSAYGIDNNVDCITFVNRQIKQNKIKNASVKKMDILNIKLKQKFSKVVMTEVIEHFDKKTTKKLLSEVKKTMENNGKLIITTPNYHSLWVVFEKLIDIFHLTPSLWGEQHLIKFTPELLKSILESQGFRVETVGTLNFISPFLSLLSQELADRVSRFEFKYIPIGSLIYIVAVKK